MDTNLVAALFSAQVGRLQLAAAAWLAHTAPDPMSNPMSNTASEVAQLVDAAEQNAQPLANAAAELGTNLDISC
jgi:hypothetical protein